MKQYNPQDYCRAELAAVRPYIPGKSLTEFGREYQLPPDRIVKLASNENLFGPSPMAIRAIRQYADQVMFYPEGSDLELRQAIAERLHTTAEHITLGNGSNEILELAGRCFLHPEDEAVYAEHAFAVYSLTTAICGANAKTAAAQSADATMPYGHDLTTMAAQITPKTRMVFIANPNNPTGTWLDYDAIEIFLRKVPLSCVVVIDQAYIEYANDCPNAIRWLEKFPNLIVTQTFSKVFGLAGLRIGYAVAGKAITELLNRIRQPFNVNLLAQKAALAALADEEHLVRSVAVNNAGIAEVTVACTAMGLKVLPSRTNFLCIKIGQRSSEVYRFLLKRGVIVRPVENYDLPEYLRVTVGLPEHNQHFLTMLQEALAEVV